MSTVVAYDFVQVNGGGEQVSRMLARELSAEMLVHSVSTEFRDEPRDDVHVRSLSSRATSRRRIPRALSAWTAFETMHRHEDVDAVIFAGHFAPLSWHAFPNACRILYLHSLPLPYLHQTGGRTALDLSGLGAILLNPAMKLLGRRYTSAVANMHHVFANSAFVAERLQDAAGRPARVLHPPVDDRFFRAGEGRPGGNYWLSWARHEPMKRIDRLIDAFRRMPDQRLVIAGSGSCTAQLMARARDFDNIEFTGTLDTGALVERVRGAIGALHVSHMEPYGIAIAEAVAAGKFVIAADGGGVREIVTTPSDGMLIAADPSPEQIVEAVRQSGLHIDRRERQPVSSHLVRVPQFVSTIRTALTHPQVAP